MIGDLLPRMLVVVMGDLVAMTMFLRLRNDDDMLCAIGDARLHPK